MTKCIDSLTVPRREILDCKTRQRFSNADCSIAHSHGYALPVAAVAAFVFGLWTEVFQGSVQGRGASVDDLVTDAIGIGLATILMLSETVRNRIASTCSRY